MRDVNSTLHNGDQRGLMNQHYWYVLDRQIGGEQRCSIALALTNTGNQWMSDRLGEPVKLAL